MMAAIVLFLYFLVVSWCKPSRAVADPQAQLSAGYLIEKVTGGR